MNLRNTWFVIALMVLVLALSACGASATATPTAKPTAAVSPAAPPTAALPPTPVPPTPVPPTPAPPTPTPVPPQATTKQVVNVRQGPGTQFSIAGKMPQNTSAVILGKNEDAKWYQVAFPDVAHPAWVASAFVTTTGTIDSLPVVAVAPPATATPGAAAPTKVAAAATPTKAVPPAKGAIGFVSLDAAQNAYILRNVIVDSHIVSDFKNIGLAPFDAAQHTNAPSFAWAPDGSGRAVYVFGPSGAQNILRVTLGNGNDNLNLDSHQGIASPSWSPDSSAVAYIGIDNSFGTQVIYTTNAAGGGRGWSFAARTDKPESFRGVAWGKTWLLFASNYTGSYEIWRLNSDGGGSLQLTNDKRENGSPSWSPDGKQFAYYSRQADGSYQIMVMNADGTGARKLTSTANNWSPVWSPDGNWIAFSSSRAGRLDIYIMDKNGGNVQLLTDKSTMENMTPGSWR